MIKENEKKTNSRKQEEIMLAKKEWIKWWLNKNIRFVLNQQENKTCQEETSKYGMLNKSMLTKDFMDEAKKMINKCKDVT